MRYWRLWALYNKFWQNADLRDILLATRGAILKYRESVLHIAVVDEDMMLIRDYLCRKFEIAHVSRSILLRDSFTYDDEFIYSVLAGWNRALYL